MGRDVFHSKADKLRTPERASEPEKKDNLVPGCFHRLLLLHSVAIHLPRDRQKGPILPRHILENHQPEYLDTEDGVKIINYQDDRWVLILPDAGEPLVHIYVNGNDRNWVDETMREYRQQVQDFIEQYRQTSDWNYKGYLWFLKLIKRHI